MTPYEVLAEVVRNDGQTTFRDEWVSFANWESGRYFHDDPSRSSKDVIQWVLSLNDLCTSVENGYHGLGKQRCIEALESAFVAFSRLDFPEELCAAVRAWRAEGLRAELTQGESATIGEQHLP